MDALRCEGRNPVRSSDFLTPHKQPTGLDAHANELLRFAFVGKCNLHGIDTWTIFGKAKRSIGGENRLAQLRRKGCRVPLRSECLSGYPIETVNG